ncbi:MAG TPA: VWA domain-containing protein [Verrucomicrobiae bacterium]|nr:VWA domain-containing protein [Verrucomicrobiae bacterium]
MRFGASFYLWFLFAVPVIAGLLLLDGYRRRRLLERLGDRMLLDRLSLSLSVEKRIMKGLLVTVASAFLVLALARPQWGMKTETVNRRGVDVMIAVDTSLSMLSEDMKPNRLAQAQSAIMGLFDLLQGDRVGLVAFAGTAYVACPLTLDYSAAAMFVDILGTDLLPVQGTNLAAAIRAATAAFPEEEGRHKVIVLITDGEDHEGEVDAAVNEAIDHGIVIHTVGVGATGGVPIPIRNARGDVTGYKEDREHRKVTSRLDEGALQSIAGATKGKYFRSTPEGIELKGVYAEIAAMDPKNMTARQVTHYEERYIIPLGAALLLLGIETVLGDRKRAVKAGRAAVAARAATAALLAGLLLLLPSPAAADPAAKNNQGNRLYEQKKFDEALKNYTDAQAERPAAPELHYNIGNVLLRKGDLDKAIEEYLRAQSTGPRSLAEAAHFNRGNALMMKGDLQPAVDEYVQALKMEPRDQDAKRNLELALRLLEKQQQQQQQQQDQNQPPDKNQKQPPPPKPDDQQKPDDKKQPQPKPGEMSQDEAKQILDALRESEKESLKKHAQNSAPPHPHEPEKDW